jgi:hypothetical protein
MRRDSTSSAISDNGLWLLLAYPYWAREAVSWLTKVASAIQPQTALAPPPKRHVTKRQGISRVEGCQVQGAARKLAAGHRAAAGCFSARPFCA